jgi:hypothetical protein
MRLLISLFSFVCTLLGFDLQPGTVAMTFSPVDGISLHQGKFLASNGNTRFECLGSATGNCNYVVYVGECSASDQEGAACTTQILEQFTLASGDAREFRTLPAGAKHCLSHDAMPVVPDCGKG